MDYLNQLNEKISLFHIISCFNILALFLNWIILNIYKKKIGMTDSFTSHQKALFKSDDEDSSVALVRMNTGNILKNVCFFIITIISCFLGFEVFLKAFPIAQIIIPYIDSIPLLVDCYLNKKSYSMNISFLMLIILRVSIVNAVIFIITIICDWIEADTFLFDTNCSQVLKVFIIALIILLVLGVTYTIGSALYSIWAYTIPPEVPEKIHMKIKQYLAKQSKNEERFAEGIKSIDYDSRMHPYKHYKIILLFRFYYVVIKMKIDEIYYSIRLFILVKHKQYIETYLDMLTHDKYRQHINVIMKIVLIVLLLAINILLSASENGYDVCANVYELVSTVIIIPIILENLSKKK